MTDLKEQAALHNTRERITIAADQLQELAAEQDAVGVVRLHSNVPYSEIFRPLRFSKWQISRCVLSQRCSVI